MRAIYAAHLDFAPGTVVEDVARKAGQWPCRGRGPIEAGETWDAGRHSFDLPEESHTLSTEVLHAPEGRLWEARWRHPHHDDPDLHMVNDIAVADKDGTVTSSLVIRTVWDKPRVAMPHFGMVAPRLVRDLLVDFEVNDAGRRLGREPHRLDAARVDDFVSFLFNRDRTRPAILVSDDPRQMGPLVDPHALARELAGLSHVFYTAYGQPGALLSRQLGDLGCRNGAMRIWWPGLTRTSDPYTHRLYSPTALRDWRRTVTPVQHLFSLVSVASVTNAAPRSHGELRRSARRAQLDAVTDTDELTELADEAFRERDAIADELDAANEDRELLRLTTEEQTEKIQRLEESMQRFARDVAQAGAEGDAGDGELDESAPVEAPSTVLEAVEQARPRCPHLSFADRAFASAEDSPFEFPEEIRDDLLKLERLAKLWAQPEGIGGMDLAQKAAELGLHWKAGVSGTATGGTRGRDYEFLWRGETHTMGPHVRMDRGQGAGRIARIYLDKYEPEDPSERLLIVAHVGRKLADTTTG